MNGKTAIHVVGITYGQLQYFVRRIDVLPKGAVSQGHDIDLSYRDVVFLRLASILRSDRFGLDAINQAITEVDQNWTNSENPTVAGVLILGNDGIFRWSLTTDYRLTVDGTSQPLTVFKHIPKFFYNVGAIAEELSDIQQLELDIMQDIGKA